MLKRSPGFWLAAAIVAYCALWLIVPKAAFIPALMKLIDSALPHAHGATGILLRLAAIVLIAAPTAVFMAVQIGMVYCFARLRMNWWQAALTLVGCLVGVAVIVVLMLWLSGIGAKMGWRLTAREVLYFMGAHSHWLKMPMFILIMFAAASIGYLVALRVKDRNLILPVVMFAAYIDFWTVTRGPVSAMMQNAPEVVGAVAPPIPQAGAGAFVPVTMVGPGDFLFMALVFAAVHRLKMNGARNYWFVFGAMTLGMFAVVFRLVDALPALIVLAIAVVAANWREFKLTRQEAISMAVVGVLMVVSLPLVWSMLGSGNGPKGKGPGTREGKPAARQAAPHRSAPDTQAPPGRN